MGIMSLENALQLARERNLDLVQVTEKVAPPVCKITDYGKYLYSQHKKEKGGKRQKADQLKIVRLTFGISQHDLETRVKQAEKFLRKGNKVRTEMPLRGRERALGKFAQEKMNKFLESLNNLCPIKIERELKREPRGFTVIISKG